MTETCASSDYIRFLRLWFLDPGRIGAILPSSNALSQLMTSEIKPSDGPLIELGAGTGVFTKALLARGVRERDLTLVEYGSDFMRMLQFRFPEARVLWMDAAQLGKYDLFPDSKVAVVVSGLPLLSMQPRKVMSILSGAFTHLRPDGRFYQFTYGPWCPIPRAILDRLELMARRVGGTIRNVPPASVYRITRRGPLGLDMRAAAGIVND